MARYVPRPTLGLDPARFLRDHWQREPLLLRGALQHWQHPLEPADIAGLCLEEAVESRLVITPEEPGQHWQLEHGPLPEDRFSRLGEQRWSILVQAVDHWFEDYAVLFEAFDFIPGWQRDDVMVSYANRGGGVGPHFDHYDVFLVQVAGHRRWQLGQRCDDSNTGDSALQAQQPMQLLEQLHSVEQYDVGPGDILYVPPYQSHCGTALDDDCITVSVGFRAPSLEDILTSYDGLQSHATHTAVPGRLLRPAPDTRFDIGARLSNSDIQSIIDQLDEQPPDREDFAQWLARHLSLPRYHTAQARALPCDGELAQQVLEDCRDSSLYRDGAARLLYRAATPQGSGARACVYIDGMAFELEAALPPGALDALMARCCSPRYPRSEDWLAMLAIDGGAALASYLFEQQLLEPVEPG